MTEITFKEDSNEFIITVKGHAGFNPGYDIVCSAVSILTTTLVQCLMDIENERIINITEHSIKCGDVYIKLSTMKSEREATNRLITVLDTIKTGFELLQSHYPNNVRLNK